MGKSSQWLRMMASETTGTEFSLIEQGTGIGHSTLPTVGYLGKVFDSCKITLDEFCPACKSKGKTQNLQAFRISFKESILLCDNPQCIYPLGHKPLNAIFTSASDWGNDKTKSNLRKRKISESAPRVSLSKQPVPSIEPSAKQPKLNTVITESSLIADCELQQNGNLCDPKSFSSDVLPINPPVTGDTTGSVEHSLASENITVPDIAPCPVQNSNSYTKRRALEKIGPKSLGGPLHLQWRNKDALCWLDCILTAIVHLETLKKALAEVYTGEEESIFQQLLSSYSKANSMTCLRREDGNVEVSLEVLVQAEKHLNEIRSVIFHRLQPQLKCELGKNDSPVFAFPLLIEKDPSLQNLFMHSFSWKFECLLCGFKSQDRCNKMLTTFTNVIPEWHPLQAVHVAPCNRCLDRSQRRQMILEKVPAVFILHFSEGLPHSELKAYSFQFDGASYEVTVVIQYQSNHFATWALTPEGSWLECDDLKGPYCQFHEKCKIPSSEMHIVFWERKNIKAISELHSKFHNENVENISLNSAQYDVVNGNVPAEFPKVDISNVSSTELPASDGESIFGFKDLADDDIITLTLVEIQVDSIGKPVDDEQVLGLDNTAEKVELKPQENTFASSLQTSCQGESSPNVTSDECTEIQSASVCLQPRQANPTTTATATLENHSTCIPTFLQVPETVLEFNDNPVVAHEFSPPCKKSKTINSADKEIHSGMKHTQYVVDNQAVNDPSLLKDNRIKGFSGSWVTSLLGKYPGLPSSLRASNRKAIKSHSKDKSPQKISVAQLRHSNDTSPLKVTDAQLPVKVASSFGGFLAKGVGKSIEDEIAKVPPSGCRKISFPTCLSAERDTCPEKSVSSSTACKFGGFQSTPDKGMSIVLNGSSKHEVLNGHQTFLEQNGDSLVEHKIHRLRLKLLKKLKAKKNELASLDMLANSQSNGRSTSKTLRNASDTGNHSKHESLQDLLKALQEHIDIADNQPVYTMNSNSSLSNSPDDAEFLAELLSPATAPSIERRDEDGSRLLDMLVDRNTVTSLLAHQNNTSCPIISANSYDYDLKEKQSLLCSNSIMNGSSYNSSNLESAMKEDVLEDLLSTFTSVGDDADLHHFEHFFES